MTDIDKYKKPVSLNPFTHFYGKRTTYFNAGNSVVTRIEEIVFAFRPKHDRTRRKHYHGKRSKTENIWMQNILDMCIFVLKFVLLIGILGCLLYIWQSYPTTKCHLMPVDSAALEESLKSNVTGQDEGLNSLLLAFYKVSITNSQPPALVLSGSTGVGKSFIIEIIINHFENLGPFEVISFPLPNPSVIVERLSTCNYTLLVLDGLYISNVPEIASWTAQIQEFAAVQGKPVWLIIAFTTWTGHSDEIELTDEEFAQDSSKVSKKIEELFTRHGALTQLVTLKPLGVKHVRVCLRNALESLDLVATEEAFENMVRDLTYLSSELRKGCKHVSRYLLQAGSELVTLKKEEEKTVLRDEL